MFRGFIGPITRNISPQPRRPRIPTAHIPVPEYNHPELQPIFIHGWRACERGLEIYHSPHTSTDEWTQTLKRAWEYGYTECFNRDREGRAQMTTAMIDNIQQPEEQPSVEEISREMERLSQNINRITEMGQTLGIIPREYVMDISDITGE
jgi:hypothetical protein